MKRVVFVVQVIAALCAIAFVIALFANEPETKTKNASASATTVQQAGGVDGAAVFADRCAGCHGSAGQGALGPKLSGGRAVERFPNIADQIAVITSGRGGMPAFGSRLSADEIRAVAEYTRTL